jgi:hypothetical protein
MSNKSKQSSTLLYILLPLAVLLIAAGLLFVFRDSLPFDLPLPVAWQPPTETPPPSATATASPLPPTATATPAPSDTATLAPSPEPSATISLTATIRSTATPFPTSTLTATPEGVVNTPTRTATSRWFYRVNTATPRPTNTPLPTRTPSITPTPTPRDHLLRIDAPGPLSKLVSPLLFDAYVMIGADGRANVELFGEDGRLIATDTVFGETGRYYRVQRYLDFSIPGAGELARLRFTTKDRYGRITSLSSVDVVLLQFGRSIPNPPTVWLDPFIIWRPSRGSTVSGGVAWIDGLAYNVNSSPVIIEILASDGSVIASREIILPEPLEGRSHARFDVGLSYTVEQRTPVLLVMRQESDNRMPGTVYLSSVEIILEP